MVGCESQLIESFVVDENVYQILVNLVVGNTHTLHLKESMVYDVKKLRTFRMIHHKYLHVGMVSLMRTEPIPEMESHQIGYFGKGIIHNLNPPLQNRIESDEGIMDMTTFNYLLGRYIHIYELVEKHLSLGEYSTIHDRQLSILCQNAINIITVQILNTLYMDSLVDLQTLSVVAHPDHQLCEGSVADQPQEPSPSLDLGVAEIIGRRVFALDHRVFLSHLDVTLLLRLHVEVVS